MSTSPPTSSGVSHGPPIRIERFRKDTEKKRSKCNRDKFKNYMAEMSRVMGFKKLSINKCLSTAVSILKLDKFCDSFASDQNGFPSDLFFEAGNYIGLVFDENGRILHITSRLTDHPLPFNMAYIGSFLNQICLNTTEILYKVFREELRTIEMRLKYTKKNKQPTTMLLKGRVLTLATTGNTKIFMGYGLIPDRRDVVRDPFMFNTGFEIWINRQCEIIKSHSWLDMLLEDALSPLRGSPVSLLALLHPDDLPVLDQMENQTKRNGYFSCTFRLYDGDSYLLVQARGYPQRTELGVKYSETYIWPVGYEDYSTGDLYIVDVKKMWNQKQKKKMLKMGLSGAPAPYLVSTADSQQEEEEEEENSPEIPSSTSEKPSSAVVPVRSAFEFCFKNSSSRKFVPVAGMLPSGGSNPAPTTYTLNTTMGSSSNCGSSLTLSDKDTNVTSSDTSSMFDFSMGGSSSTGSRGNRSSCNSNIAGTNSLTPSPPSTSSNETPQIPEVPGNDSDKSQKTDHLETSSGGSGGSGARRSGGSGEGAREVIEKIVMMKSVLQCLKSSNKKLYNKFSGLMMENSSDLLAYLPLILKMVNQGSGSSENDDSSATPRSKSSSTGSTKSSSGAS